MTAFAFILGVMPLIGGVYATARNIMGVALVGGMLFATLLAFFFVYPALTISLVDGGFERRRERKNRTVMKAGYLYNHFCSGDGGLHRRASTRRLRARRRIAAGFSR